MDISQSLENNNTKVSGWSSSATKVTQLNEIRLLGHPIFFFCRSIHSFLPNGSIETSQKVTLKIHKPVILP
jgi:hypothetical protein